MSEGIQRSDRDALRSSGKRPGTQIRRIPPKVEELEDRTTPATVTVNAGSVVQTVPANFLGTNVAWWDSIGTTAQTQALVQAAGIGAIRITGGSSADTFHFTDPPPYNGAGTVANMATMISNLGATGIVTVNYGTGSPQEAAAMIAYLDGATGNTTSIGVGEEWSDASQSWVNVDWKTAGYWASLRAATPLAVDDGLNFLRIGRSAPFNIHYFEIGNEVYGSWETDEHGTGGDTGQPHDPATYVAFGKQLQSLTSKIAPTISFGIDADETYSSAWVASVLQQSVAQGFTVGWISDHNYMQEPGSESDATLLTDTSSNASSPYAWANRAATYHTLLQQYLGAAAASQVQLLATEYNSVSYDPGKQTTSLVDGLFFADSLGSLLQTNYAAGVSWDLHNGDDTGNNNSTSLYGWRNFGDYGLLGSANDDDPPYAAPNVAYPTYFADELVSKFAEGGASVESVASSDPNLSVYGVREPNGHLALLVIDKSSTAALTGQFQLTGFQPAAQATVWQYGETQDTAQSHTTDGHSALANSTATLSVSGSNFSYQFPAYSMTVLDLTPNPQSIVYVSNTNFGLGSAPTVGQNIADADQGTMGSQPAVFDVNAFATIAAAQVAVASSGTIVVNAGAYPESPSVTGTETFRITGNVTVATIDSVSGTVVDLLANTLTTGSAAGNDTLAGIVEGNGGSLKKLGSDTLMLSGTDTYTGATTVSAGTLLVTGSTSASSAVSVAAGATLGGTGSVGGAVTSAGAIAPGTAAGSIGTLSTGPLTLGPGTLSIDLNSKTAYDSVNAASVNLASATLALDAGMGIVNGNAFTLLAVAGTTARVIGTFNGLPEGGTFTVGTQTFRISYVGGDGNDVVLAAVAAVNPTLIGNPVLNGGIAYVNSTNAVKQHSMVENVVYSFSQTVTLSVSNFTLTGINGTTAAPAVNVASSNGTLWTVTFSGAGVNTKTNSIGDGEYSLVLSGVSGLANNTFDFFRLLGDMDGSGTVDAADLSMLNSTYLRATSDSAYLGADDFDGSGTIDSADVLQFAGNFLHSVPTPLPN